MEKEQRIETLENEFKLIKGELKQTLAGVRDFLLDTGISESEYATILQSVGGGMQTLMRGEITMARDTNPPGPPPPEPEKTPSAEKAVEENKSSESEPEMLEEVIEEEEYDTPAPRLSEKTGRPDEPFMSNSELPEETIGQNEPDMPEETVRQNEPDMPESGLLEQQAELRQSVQEARSSIPPVNLLSNLICWVSSIKKEIGIEQLPVLLEVYGTTGHLSPELKEVILHLADIIEPQSENADLSGIWSQSILELHGILTGGDAPLHPLKPFWNDGDDEALPGEGQPGDSGVDANKPLKLKLVIPVNSGDDSITREFSISLNPEE